MQTKVAATPLCPVCELTHTNHTLEYKTTSGKTGSMICCVSCRPKMEQRLRIARMDVLGIDMDEQDLEDLALLADDFEMPIKGIDEIIADKHARAAQQVLGREEYVDVGKVSTKTRKAKRIAPTGLLDVPDLAAMAASIMARMKV